MDLNRTHLLACVVVLFLFCYVSGLFLIPSVLETGINAVRKSSRWNLPWLPGYLRCNGCPPRACEDDEAIIHGYCCGCAYSRDHLPVLCPEFLQCPLNLHGLCHDYEYMMRCCC